MRWEDERYVRLYTRDTTDWLALSFDAQALLALILRKVDRAGLMPLGRHGKRGVVIAIGHPGLWERLGPALEELLADGCVHITADGGTLVVPNFLAAQEARASDKARQQKARELARDTASVTRRDDSSQAVTESHADLRPITDGHDASQTVTPSCAVPSRAVLTTTPQPPKGGVVGEFADAVESLLKARDPTWTWTEQAMRSVNALRGKGPPEEVLRRLRIALAWPRQFPTWSGLQTLVTHWDAYAKEESGRPGGTRGPAPASSFENPRRAQELPDWSDK